MKIYPVIDVSKGIKVKQIKNVEAHCKIDIQAYEVSEGELSRTVVCSRINKASRDRKSTRLNSSHANISYAVFCLKKKKNNNNTHQQ